MTMEVRGPGGVMVRFPDGTDQATIDRVMREAVSGQTVSSSPVGGSTPAAAAPSASAPAPESGGRGGFLDVIGALGGLVNPVAMAGQVAGGNPAAASAAQGMTAGFSDEIAGAGVGAVEAARGGSFTEGYNRAVEGQRNQLKDFADKNPAGAGAMEVAGALLTAPLAGSVNAVRTAANAPMLAKGAASVANAALTGAGYGAAYGYGAGEGGVGNRLRGAGEGAAVGAVTGAAAVPVVAGAAKIGQAIMGAPSRAASIVAQRPVAERDVWGAVKKDAAVSGKSPDQMAGDIIAAQQSGIPMAAMDIGESTRSLARGAADISPQGRAVLNEALDQRQATQADRIIRNITTYAPGVNAPKIRDFNLKAAKSANKAAYDRAYMSPEAQGIWHEGMEQLTVSPDFQDAIREAERIGRNASAVDGSRPPVNPFRANPDGTINPIPNVRPSLQFWDKVKQSLDGKISAERGPSGNRTRLAQLTQLKSQLVGYLDSAVPAYKAAREGAFGYFQADNALEAGANFVRMGRGVFKEADALKAVQKMTKPERDLFAEGYATQLIADIEGIRDSQAFSVVDRIFNSRTARRQFEIAMGKESAEALEAAIRLEKIMQTTRKFIQGGSHTAQYQIAAQALTGMGAGAGGLYLSGGDWSTAAITAILVGGGARLGGRGVSALVRRTNEQNARRVAEMLASDEPQVVQEALARIARNPGWMENLRGAYGRLAKAAVPLLEESGGTAPAMVDSGTGSQPAQANDERR